MGATGKRSGVLFAGIILVAVGMILLVGPRSVGFAVWLGRLWPLFLVLAGLFRIAGFAIERRPRSPLGGALLVALGIVLLVARIDSESSLLAIYGKYWIIVLGIYSLAELLRFYSYRQGEGPQPKFFSTSKLLTVFLIAGTGILSGRLAGKGTSLLSMVRIPAGLANLSDSGGSQSYIFEDPPSITETSGATAVTISNSRGDINIVGGARALKIILTKTVTALSETEARSLADQIKLVVERVPGAIKIHTNRDQLDGNLKTSIRIELPRGLTIAVTNNIGSVSLSNADGPASVSASGGPVSVSQIAGNVDVALDGVNSLDASSITGNLSVERAKDTKIANIGGALDLEVSNGSVDLRDVRGPVTLDAPSCRIKATNLVETSTIKSGDSTIEVIKSSSLAIDAPGSNIRAQQVNGDLQISSSGGSVRLASVEGAVNLSAERSNVQIDGLNGDARVQASHTPVAIKNFRGSALVETSYDRIMIAPGDALANIQARNNHGDIRIAMPASGEFQLTAEASQGSIKCPILYGSPNPSGTGANLTFGASGPKIVLTTLGGDIVLERDGSHRRRY